MSQFLETSWHAENVYLRLFEMFWIIIAEVTDLGLLCSTAVSSDLKRNDTLSIWVFSWFTLQQSSFWYHVSPLMDFLQNIQILSISPVSRDLATHVITFNSCHVFFLAVHLSVFVFVLRYQIGYKTISINCMNVSQRHRQLLISVSNRQIK